LDEHSIEPAGDFIIAGYDPPWVSLVFSPEWSHDPNKNGGDAGFI